MRLHYISGTKNSLKKALFQINKGIFSLHAKVTRYDTQLQAERSGQSFLPYSNVLVETKCNYVINFYYVFELCAVCTVPKPNPKNKMTTSPLKRKIQMRLFVIHT